MIKKLFQIAIIFATAFLINASCEDGTTGSGDRLTIAPKINSVSGNPSFSMMSRSVISEPRNSFVQYVLPDSYDSAHKTLVPMSEWLTFIGRASAPVFSGFEKVDYNDGDTFESDFYNKTILTTVSRGTTSITFNGEFNDGGYYHLTINADNTYTYEQYSITDFVLVQEECLTYPIGHPNRSSYIGGISRLVIYSTVTGTVDNLSSSGTGCSRVFEFMPGTLSVGDIRTADDFDVTPGNYWHPVGTYVYDFNIKSTEQFFGMRNLNAGQLRYQYNDMNGILSLSFTYSDPFPNIIYSNTTLLDLLKITNTQGTSSFAYQDMSPDQDYLIYQLNNVWQSTIWLGALVGGMPADAATKAQKLQDIEDTWNAY